MADPTPIQKLRDAFANAPDGPVILNDTFWINAGLVPPENFTADIKAAFRLSDDTNGLEITYSRASVSEVTSGSFSIPEVSLTFLNAPTSQTYIIGKDNDSDTPILGIDVAPQEWQLKDFFTAMSGYPYSVLEQIEQRFFYTTAEQSLDFNGASIPMATGQNLYGNFVVPSTVKLILDLIQGLPNPSDLVLSGPIRLSSADLKNTFVPEMDVSAGIPSAGDLKLFFIDVSLPRIGFVVKTVEDELPAEEGEAAEKTYNQNPQYFVEAVVTLQSVDEGTEIPVLLRSLIPKAAESPSGTSARYSYAFSIAAADSDKPITPSAVIALMAGQSYFRSVPPVLQEYLASVQMQGFQIAGPASPTMRVTSLAAQLGSVQGKPIPLFIDPTSGEQFEIQAFSFNWRMQMANDKPSKTFANFSASFTLFPDIFRQKDGSPGGEFRIQIDQDLNFNGNFDGKASMNDVLMGVTGGAIGMPQGVEVEFSDIIIAVQTSEKAYQLGFTVDASLDVPFIQTPDGQKLIEISNMAFKLGASTPSRTENQKGATVYTGAIDGQVRVGPLSAAMRVDYDGTAQPPVWSLDTALLEPVSISDLLRQFFDAYQLPDFIPGDLTVEAFALNAEIPVVSSKPKDNKASTALIRPARHVAGRHLGAGWTSHVRPVGALTNAQYRAALPILAEKQQQSSYKISGKLSWNFQLTPDFPVATLADIGLQYDGNRQAGAQFSGQIIGTITLDTIGATVEIGYRFGPAKNDVQSLVMPMTQTMRAAVAAEQYSQVLWMAWKGFRAEYSFTEETITFSMNGWTVGGLVTALMEMLGDPYFTLSSPWDMLNTISLDGLSISFDLKSGVKNRISAHYKLPSSINLGFLTVHGLVFRQVDGKTTLVIDGKTQIPGLENEPLFNKESEGQDVKNMPDVPGRGNSYFHLYMMALGQRVAIYDPGAFDSTKAVIEALADIPPSDGPGMPFDPSQQKSGQPYYNPSSNWLAALHFGVLKIPATSIYSVDMQIVFNDPNLYGLRIALNGEKVKVLDGLEIDVLYKRITDDIGLYQIEFTLPGVLRNLDFGAFKVTLPVIGIQIYTNGDFLIDFGFPKNMDFSRSFRVEAIIYGVPVLGSAGFYFGKLSNATAPNLPVTTRGTFHPVIVFGFGAEIGLGRSVEYGILKAGFSITIFGIIEGTLAAWHPYQLTQPYQLTRSSSSNEVQGDYYFKLTGTFGLIGRLYGSINFAIIKADLDITVKVYIQITYESFRKIPLMLAAEVNVSVKVKIDLGLFSISISLSFAATIREELTIGSDSQAPWDDPSRQLPEAVFIGVTADGAYQRQRRLPVPRTLFDYGIYHRAFRLDATQGLARLKRKQSLTARPDTLEITLATQMTVLGAENAGYAQQEGALVVLFSMDAPEQPTEGTSPAGDGADTSFGKLCAQLLPWILHSVTHETGLPLPSTATGTLSRAAVEGILQTLSDPDVEPFTPAQIEAFLAENFTVKINLPDANLSEERRAALNAGATLFPALPFLRLSVPDPTQDTGEVTIDLSAYVSADTDYQMLVRQIFAETAANVDSETDGDGTQTLDQSASPSVPMAATILTDYIVLLARQLVQRALDVFDDYPYPLTDETSINTIVNWANNMLADQLNAADLIASNMTYPLTAGLTLKLASIHYMVQSGDTLQAIADRYGIEPASLITENRSQNNLIASRITVELNDKVYSTQPGDDFNAIAAGVGLTLKALAQETQLYTQAGLLAAAVQTCVPDVAYTTRDEDTIATILARYHVPKESFLTASTMAKANLFRTDTDLAFAVPRLSVLPEDSLWPSIVATGSLGQTAGMAARYMLHGMRLPVAPGLTLPKDFLYGAPYWDTQTAYSLYQLTGQQVPLANRSDDYTITLSRPDTPDYDWISIGSSTSASFDNISQAGLLTQVVDTARTNGYKPRVEALMITPETELEPRSYGMATYVPWKTADSAGLAAVCAPPAGQSKVADQASAPQASPILFELSPALQQIIEANQAALAAQGLSFSEMQPYLPPLIPEVGTTDPATQKTAFQPIDDYSFATRIDFRIKALAQTADQAPQRPDANDIVPPGPGNSGSPAQDFAPYAYEIIGPNPGESVLLERLLTSMASIGEDLVSGLFLTYADINNGVPGLTSQAPSDFLSYIVQSNLSTETNPPAGAFRANAQLAEEPPTGIAMAPAEFIKLLWELSTVNSGGSFLFYQNLVTGSGLPTGLFDNDGTATLTLVITLRRDAALQSATRVFNAVNALVTSAPIDPKSSVVQLTGTSAPAPSDDVSGQTPAEITAAYGLDLAGLAKANPGATLTAGAHIPVSGLIAQLTPQQAATADPLQTLADYYSAGCVPGQGVSKADIMAWNPGVSVAPLSIFRLPPFTYQIGGAPGSTLTDIARYFNTSLASLIYGARNTAGLFGDVVNIDPLALAAKPNLGLGNAGFSLQRERGAIPQLPENPTTADLKTYTQDTLLQLYQLLSAQIVATPYFDASQMGASFGPKDPPAEPSSTPRSRMLKRQALAEDTPYHYSQALGFTGKALTNAVPGDTSLLDPSGNPYLGIGTPLTLALDWLDLFGNRIPNPFNTVEQETTPPYGTLGTMLTCSDALIPIDAWPSTTRAYMYSGDAGAPQLSVELVFDPTPYEPDTQLSRASDLHIVRAGDTLPIWQRTARSDLSQLTRVYFQLIQDYTSLGMMGLDGPVVTMAFENSLMAEKTQPLTTAEREQILTYLSTAITYLSARADGHTATPPNKTTITRSIDLNELDTTADIHQLELGLSFTRQAEWVAPNLRAVRGGLRAISNIPANGLIELPQPNLQAKDETQTYPVALTEFALRFEKTFQTENWQMRVGTGSPDPSASSTSRGSTVWAVRMAKPDAATPAGIGYKIGNTASYFAPLPIASNLVTIEVDLRPYETGTPYSASDSGTLTTFTSVDPNVWLEEALTAVDDVLAASFSTPLYQLDRLLGLTDAPETTQDGLPIEPEKTGYLWRLLEHKKTLAHAISSTATSVLVGGDDSLQPAAIEKLKQALLNRLSSANSLTAVAVLPVTGTSYAPPLGRADVPPRLFGQPSATLTGASTELPNDNFSLTTGKIPLTQGEDTSTLAFLATSRSADSESYVELKLDYTLTHIEYDIRGVQGIENYEQSSWISLLTGPITTPIKPAKGDSFSIPVALRALPQPATVEAQTGIPSMATPQSPAELKSWRYDFTYLLQQAAQDSVMADVIFNQDASISGDDLVSASKDKALFDALAQFVAIYPAVARDLESYLRPISGETSSSDPSVTLAKDAIAAFEAVTSNVATAYDEWARGALTAQFAKASPRVEYTFEILLTPSDEGHAQIEIIPQRFEVGQENKDNFLSLAQVLINSQSYEPHEVRSTPETGAVVWQYKRREGASQDLPEWLAYETARTNSERQVGFSDLDLFALQSGWASIQVMRNRHLSPDLGVKTTPAFEFTTAPAKFANPLVPLISIPNYSLDGDTPRTVTQWLEPFFNELLAPLPQVPIQEPLLVRIETTYCYNLVGEQHIPDTVLPLSLLAPTSTEGKTDPSFIATVGDYAQSWFNDTKPLVNASAGFSFDITVFSAASSASLPLLRISNLSLAASLVKPDK
ncbi:hypothetical protein EHLJMEHL_03833 [Vreelandella titanicae]